MASHHGMRPGSPLPATARTHPYPSPLSLGCQRVPVNGTAGWPLQRYLPVPAAGNGSTRARAIPNEYSKGLLAYPRL